MRYSHKPDWTPFNTRKVSQVAKSLRLLNDCARERVRVSLDDTGQVRPTDFFDGVCRLYGSEHIPGKSARFDAIAIARRLLACYADQAPRFFG